MLVALAVPWTIARYVTRWEEAGKQRNTSSVILSLMNPQSHSFSVLLSTVATIVSNFEFAP